MAVAVPLDPGPVGHGIGGRPDPVEADGRQRRGVQHPLGARAVLDPDRAPADEGVEPPAVEPAGHRLVVADGPQPLAAGQRGVRVAEHRGELAVVVDDRRAHPRRLLGGGQGDEVDVVVVQPGQERAAAAVDHVLAGRGGEGTVDLGHDPLRDAHVDEAALDDDIT